MELVRDFREISKENVDLAGGKGASLGEMTKAGIPVPPGFVVLSESFEQFIKEADLEVRIDAVLDKVNTEEVHTVEEASEEIKAFIIDAQMPKDIEKKILNNFKKLGAKFVAVRSSATAEDSASAAWAGQLDSFLNTTKDTLLENVKKCWASLFTPRAIFYRFEQKIKGKILVAVVVQKMVNSEESGIAFSVHPVTEDPNQLIIEAGFGLGEAIVSGQITPDSYVVDKQDWHIIDVNVNEQAKGLFRKKDGGNEWRELGEKGSEQVLNGKEILELAKLIVKIEKHYGFPVDVEWAREKGEFYIVQSRPITTLTSKKDKEEKKVKKKDEVNEIVSKIKKDYDFLWTFGIDYLLSSIGVGSYSDSHKRDFIACGALGDGSWFISNKDRKELSEEGFKVFYKGFEKYKQEHKINTEITRKFIKEQEKIDLRELDNKGLLVVFEKFVENGIRMFDLYMWTECFTADKVEEVLNNTEKGHDLKLLRKNADEMAKLKYGQRALINKMAIPGGVFKKCQKEIEKRFKIKNLEDYHYNEIIRLLKGEKVEIPNRDYWIHGALFEKEITGEKAKKIIEEILRVDKSIREIKGSIGNKGYYKGIAKRIDFDIKKKDYNDEIRKMKQGSVLVSCATGPDMILACKKAGAIVTDDGGIAAHAAIVSRELGIPSVIGTKIATQIIKDGDLVEVDANNGIVRVIGKEDREEREVVVSHRSDLLTQDLILKGIFLHCKFKDYGATFNFPYIKYEHSTGDISYPVWQLKELSELILPEKDFKKLVSNLDKEVLEYKRYIKKFEKEINSKGDEEKILEYFDKSLKMVSIIPYFAFEKGIHTVFERESIPLHAVPSSITYTSMVDEELKKIAGKNKKELGKKGKISGNLKKDLEKFCNRFGYLGMKYFKGEPWTIEEAYEMLFDVKEGEKESKKAGEKYSSPYIQFASDLLRLRTQNWELMCKGTSLFRKFILKHFKNLEYEKLLDLRIDDLLDVIQGKSTLEEKAKKRDSFILEITEEGVYLTDEDSEKEEEIIDENLDSLKGVCAQPGKVKGRIKVVLSAKECKKVEQGDILVARMSTPDFLPGMRKASAFITDIGGITSHAAIVAREMKKPCIIGTKIATKVLKDGMMVEVDADNGIVKILS